MAKYNIGDRVVKNDSESKGVIIEVLPARRGRQLYRVSWDHGITDELEVNLIPNCDVSDPYERCMSGIFGSYSDFSKINTTFKIRNSNNSTISSLKASKTLFRAYQFKPPYVYKPTNKISNIIKSSSEFNFGAVCTCVDYRRLCFWRPKEFQDSVWPHA